MSLLKILTYPDPVLKKKASPIEVFDAELKDLASNMLETMYDSPGVGLAANQVGILKRIVVIDVDYDIEGEEQNLRRYVRKNPRILVNPIILEKSGTILFKEGCLSVPDYTEQVKRFEFVKIQFQDLIGKIQSLEGENLLAVAIQHELDHLDGKLFIDRLSIAKRSLIKNKIKKERSSQFERSRFHVEL